MTVSTETGLAAVAEVKTLLGVEHVRLTGSVAIEGSGNDADVLALCPEYDEALLKLDEAGYVPCCAGAYGGGARSAWRKGDINVIVCYTADEYSRWLTSLALCLELVIQYGYTTKAIRASVHKAVRGELHD